MPTYFDKTKVKTERIQPIAVTKEQLQEIDRRAAAAQMMRAEYVRARALGHECAPKEPETKKRR